jgi:hypothetical protein
MPLLLFALLFFSCVVLAQERPRPAPVAPLSLEQTPKGKQPERPTAEPTAKKAAEKNTESFTARPAERAALDKQIAAQFAPLFYQGLGDQPRADYITNFDFDGDWKGDNNWQNLNNRAHRLRAYIYYSVVETPTHYYVHYAAFHPRDYKGEAITSALLDEFMRRTLPQIGKPNDPAIEKANEVALSHENDLEGCLVIAEKRGETPAQARVLYVETMAHNTYLKYRTSAVSSSVGDPIELNGSHPLLYIEPKGHGMTRYTGDAIQLNRRVADVLIYGYKGQAEDHDLLTGRNIGYDLISIYDTLWQRGIEGENETYGESYEYPTQAVTKFQFDQPPAALAEKFGQLGVAFRGSVGFKNKARPPWAWFDGSERDRPRGEWFFDPAGVIARHFGLGAEWTTAYSYNPYFKIGLPADAQSSAPQETIKN